MTRTEAGKRLDVYNEKKILMKWLLNALFREKNKVRIGLSTVFKHSDNSEATKKKIHEQYKKFKADLHKKRKQEHEESIKDYISDTKKIYEDQENFLKTFLTLKKGNPDRNITEDLFRDIFFGSFEEGSKNLERLNYENKENLKLVDTLLSKEYMTEQDSKHMLDAIKRLHKNKLFTASNLQKLIENVIYLPEWIKIGENGATWKRQIESNNLDCEDTPSNTLIHYEFLNKLKKIEEKNRSFPTQEDFENALYCLPWADNIKDRNKNILRKDWDKATAKCTPLLKILLDWNKETIKTIWPSRTINRIEIGDIVDKQFVVSYLHGARNTMLFNLKIRHENKTNDISRTHKVLHKQKENWK